MTKAAQKPVEILQGAATKIEQSVSNLDEALRDATKFGSRLFMIGLAIFCFAVFVRIGAFDTFTRFVALQRFTGNVYQSIERVEKELIDFKQLAKSEGAQPANGATNEPNVAQTLRVATGELELARKQVNLLYEAVARIEKASTKNDDVLFLSTLTVSGLLMAFGLGSAIYLKLEGDRRARRSLEEIQQELRSETGNLTEP